MANLIVNKADKYLPNGSVIRGVFHFKFEGDLSDPNNPYHATRVQANDNSSVALGRGRPLTTQLPDFYNIPINSSGRSQTASPTASQRQGVPNPMFNANSPVSRSSRLIEIPAAVEIPEEVPIIDYTSTSNNNNDNNSIKNGANMMLEDLDNDQLQRVIVSLGLGRYTSQFTNYRGNVLSEVTTMEDLQDLDIKMPAPFAKTLLSFITTANRDGVDPNFLL